MDATDRSGLYWGIKNSFLEYIARMPDGKSTLSEGATPAAGALHFPLARHVTAHEASTLEFAGATHFSGHFGFLGVRIGQLALAVTGDTGVLTIADSLSREAGARRAIATVPALSTSMARDHVVYRADEVCLAPEGVELFGDVYETGCPLEPLLAIAPRQ